MTDTTPPTPGRRTEKPADVAEIAAACTGELPPGERDRLRASLSAVVSDSEAIRRLTDPGNPGNTAFYPSGETAKPSTEDTIDRFLNTYGTSSPEETELLERLIFNPVADYAQQLAKEEEQTVPPAPQGSGNDALIDRFIIAHRQKTEATANTEKTTETTANTGTPPETANPSLPATHLTSVSKPAAQTPPAQSSSSLLSESLAKIYIKTGRYRQACEILERLSLAFPEKNTYFADQLRFLRKLIIIDDHRRQATASQAKENE